MHLNQLSRKILFKAQSGSQLYGLATPQSDVDYVSVFLPCSEDLLSLQKCEYIDNSTKSSSEDRRNTNEDIDDQQHALQRYLHLVLHGNPNLTELLFAPLSVVEIEDERFKELRNNYSLLVSSRVYDSFMGFAVSQRKKLEYKKTRYDQLGKAIMYLNDKYSKDELNDTKIAFDESTSNWLNDNLSEYKGKKSNCESFHKGLPLKVIYEKIVSEYERYGWRVKTDSFLSLGYDTKFASHTIRLLYEGEQLLLNGKLEFPISGPAHDDIMDIKTAQVSIEDFYYMCEVYENRCRRALEKTKLSKNPDWKWANNWLVDVLKKAIIEGEI